MAKYTIRETPEPQPRKRVYPFTWSGIIVAKVFREERCGLILRNPATKKDISIWFSGKPINQCFYYFLLELLDEVTIRGRVLDGWNVGFELQNDEMFDTRTEPASTRRNYTTMCPGLILKKQSPN